MDIDGLQTLLNASAVQIRLLATKLAPGQAYPFLLHLGPDFRPAEAITYIRPTDAGYQLRTSAALAYVGDSIQLWAFASRSFHDEASLQDLVAFLRRHFADTIVDL